MCWSLLCYFGRGFSLLFYTTCLQAEQKYLRSTASRMQKFL
ncbi:hypothetical protein CsSME_00036309 [Camellia sinensis var. sinensis]